MSSTPPLISIVMPNNMKKLFYETMPVLEKAFHILESGLEKPDYIKHGDGCVFRYKSQSIEAAIIQKLARVISGLNASLALLENGFTQEMGALFRMLDEFNEDIIFISQPLRTGELTELHQKYLVSFYQEEFDDVDPFLSEQRRPTIKRNKIQAAISKMPENELNPSDSQELSRTIHQAYSGYVHGASVHILEMYGGNPPRYHLSGMLGTPRIDEFTNDLWNYVYRGLLSVMMASLSLGNKELTGQLFEFRKYFEETSKTTSWEHPEKILTKIKKKKGKA
jgi:hypothetical protein